MVVVVPPREMLAPHARDRRRLEDLANELAPLDLVPGVVAQLVAQPVLDRQAVALLLAVEDLARKVLEHRLLEDRLGLERAHPPLGREPGRELDELVIEKRDADLERARH